MIKAFKCRAQAIFSLFEKTHPPGSQIFFIILYTISTQISYIHQKQDTNSCFAKLRANSYLFRVFYTPCIRRISTFRAKALRLGVFLLIFFRLLRTCIFFRLLPYQRKLVLKYIFLHKIIHTFRNVLPLTI
jgi:hypothetical protein